MRHFLFYVLFSLPTMVWSQFTDFDSLRSFQFGNSPPKLRLDFVILNGDTLKPHVNPIKRDYWNNDSCHLFMYKFDTLDYNSKGMIEYHFTNLGDSTLVLKHPHGNQPHHCPAGYTYATGESGCVICRVETKRMGPIRTMGTLETNSPTQQMIYFSSIGFVRVIKSD